MGIQTITLHICCYISALDAYVLLEVYEVLKEKVTQFDLQINLEPPVTVKLSGSKKSRQTRMQQRVAEKPKPDIDVSERVSSMLSTPFLNKCVDS